MLSICTQSPLRTRTFNHQSLTLRNMTVANEPSDSRPVVFVPLPPLPRLGWPARLPLGLLVALLISGVVVAVALILNDGSFGLWFLGMGAIVGTMVAMETTAIIAITLSKRVYDRQRAEFIQARTVDVDDPMIAALQKVWDKLAFPPPAKKVQAAWEATASEQFGDGPAIICYGEAQVPEVGELRFQPIIITPTARRQRQLKWLIPAAVCCIWLLLSHLRLLPSWFPDAQPFIVGMGYFLVFGVITLFLWVRGEILRPTYIRMAPGMIQFLVFPLGRRSQPIIRSYPMTAGTLAIFTRIHKRRTLTLLRGDNHDILSFAEMENAAQRIEQTWQAILSTAPTPPLDVQELVG